MADSRIVASIGSVTSVNGVSTWDGGGIHVKSWLSTMLCYARASSRRMSKRGESRESLSWSSFNAACMKVY
jgi:hypothetical protein